MNLTLYVSNHCPACEKVKEFMNHHSFEYRSVNIETEEVPVNGAFLIVPALYVNDKLQCYGYQIIEYLESQQQAS